LEKISSERPPAKKNTTTDIIKKGSVITIITLVSRPLGYVREAIQAYLFGATLLVDAFVVAFNFPELIQTLFFSGATSAFLIPVCTRYLKNNDEYSEIYSTFINLSILVTAFLSLLLVLFSSSLMGLVAPGFNEETRVITRQLFVIMIPVILLHTLLSIIKAFLNAKEHFAAPELSGIFWNLAFIGAAVVLSKKFGIYSLAIGVTLGSFIQVLSQIPYLRKFQIRYRLRLSLSHPAVKEAKKLFTGALVATSIVPINSFVGRIIGSYLPQGEVASLAYAFRIFILPFSLFAVPIYTVMFSKMSKLYHDKKREEIFSHIDSSIILLCVTLIPSTVVLCGTAEGLIKILYERGAFTAQETATTTKALLGYGTGLIFYALSISFVRMFNALHDMRTPALVGVTSIVLNALLASLLMVPLKNLGISLATSIVSLYNFLVLLVLLKRRTGYAMAKHARVTVIESITAGVALLVLILVAKYLLPAKPYLSVAINLGLTVVVYGLFFRKYYMGMLRRRI
jgi:putative peptidoglycan lipid II flippase